MKAILSFTSALLLGGPLYAQATPTASSRQVTGKVARFLLAPRGEVDGFLLQDGTRVQFPPHLAPQLTAAVRVNDEVSVATGAAPTAIGEFGRGVRADSIKDQRTGKTLVDQPPASPPPAPSEGRSMLDAKGTVARILLNDRGDADGLLLDSGAEVRFPPPVGAAFLALYKQAPKAALTVSGPGTSTSYGKVLDAVSMAYNGQVLRVADRPGPGDRPLPPRGADGDLPPPPPDAP